MSLPASHAESDAVVDTDGEDGVQTNDALSTKPQKIAVNTSMEGATSPAPQSPLDGHGSLTDVSSLKSTTPRVQVTESSPVATRRRDSELTIGASRTSLREREGSDSARVEQSSPSSQDVRNNRRRSAIDHRSSNRISGFLSNLMRRPERDRPSTPPGRTTNLSPPSPLPEKETLDTQGFTTPSLGSTDPPPPLAPPSLHELGLSLSVLTAQLSPSHFSSPPTSGCFLAPHYLLLCHAQGLDVLPLHAPPAPQPYALIRRVAFKSVVIMEERNILVAIAGRRDGVRVYALDKVREAVEWRLEVEVRRERERIRREESKNIVISGGVNNVFNQKHYELLSDIGKPQSKGRLSTSSSVTPSKGKLHRRSSNPSASLTSRTSPSVPRPPAIKKLRSHPSPNNTAATSRTEQIPSIPFEPPPAYAPERLLSSASVISVSQARSRRGSVNEVLAASINRRSVAADRQRDPDGKGDWMEANGSDDEAINIVAAGASGSQALDERTSTSVTSNASPVAPPTGVRPTILDIPTSPHVPTLRRRSATSPVVHTTAIQRARRPSNLDLSLPNTTANHSGPPSPAPTLLTLQQALAQIPSSPPDTANTEVAPDEADRDGDLDGDDGDDDEGSVSFLDILMASRLPNLPPPGSRLAQQPILLSSHRLLADDTGSPRESSSVDTHGGVRGNHDTDGRTRQNERRRRRRWSVLDGVFQRGAPAGSDTETSKQFSASRNVPEAPRRTGSATPDSTHDHAVPVSPAPSTPSRTLVSDLPRGVDTTANPTTSSSSRFLNKISNALHYRSDNEVAPDRIGENDTRKLSRDLPPQTPAPKLEYVKLPGTKGSLMVKAVETAKKSFLAILCGENGSKVELFAGTYRTNLTLSRTFILPDSPRLLELQLQGDDLVEVFLVFSQNVFALEPATVRVREVRIGRSERRAARRRARENRTDLASATQDAQDDEEETRVNVSIGVPQASSASDNLDDTIPSAAPSSMRPPSPVEETTRLAGADTASAPIGGIDDIISVATAQMGPYTTFQQLSFVPMFPLATIAEECIIPPTYTSFLRYREKHEPKIAGAGTVEDLDLSRVSFSPPGLPTPAPATPSKWFYRDPKGVVQGPWKASLMQSWYKEGLLPLDLPVRRDGETDYVVLRELRQQAMDPSHPFRPPPPPLNAVTPPLIPDPNKPLLSPISLLAQARHFGPPPLFFCSRGGHSTTIVDNKGRSVLRDKFLWSPDPDDGDPSTLRMGDVKRLEAFDVKERSVLVAMRQGGLEAVDLGDALLKPADHSRQALPYFTPSTPTYNRRKAFIWRIGAPVTAPSSMKTQLPTTASSSTTPASSTPKKPLATKSPARSEFLGRDDEYEHDEVLFLGRNDDDLYLCERNAGKFRVLHLRPTAFPA